MQDTNMEARAEFSDNGPSPVDPERLSPEDFYTWSIEQAGGDFDAAVSTIDNPSDALRFVAELSEDYPQAPNTAWLTAASGASLKLWAEWKNLPSKH